MSKWWMVKCALAALVFAPLLGACDGTDEQVAGAAPLPETAAATLAQKLVAAQDLETAVGITREVLARGGVATRDGDVVLVEAIGPAAPFHASSLETLHLAMQARHRPGAGTLTAAEFAQMLEGFGWPFRGADPDRDADQLPLHLPEELQQLVRQERAALEDQARNAEIESEAAVEASRLAASAHARALVEQIREATLAWQQARQAWARAAVADKPAAQERVAEALAARKALIEQRGLASRESGQALQALRERNRSDRETAARLEQVAARIGPDHAAGEQLMELFATWVREAARDPDDPRNFTPLFLAEMARLQDPPVDLAGSRFQRPGRGPGAPVDLRGPPRSAQMRLTLLEMQLIAAAFHRGVPATADDDGNDGPGHSVAAIANWLVPIARADASTPCSDFKKALRDTAGAPAGEGATVLASEALGKALGKAVEVATDKAGSEAFGEMMGSIGIAARIVKLVSFYADTQVSVHAAPDPVHKPPTGGLGIAFTATAGVSEDELEEYERLNGDRASQVQRDCYATLGLPTMPNIAELAKEAENWVVEWKIVEGKPMHVDFGPLSVNKIKHGQYGVYGMQLKRRSPHAATARLIVVQTSVEQVHAGTQVRTYAVTKGSVNAAGTPSLGTWVNAVKGGLGLADALVELAAGWTQSMVKPKAYASVEIQYHCEKPTTLHDVSDAVADGGDGDGKPDGCLLPAPPIN